MGCDQKRFLAKAFLCCWDVSCRIVGSGWRRSWTGFHSQFASGALWFSVKLDPATLFLPASILFVWPDYMRMEPTWGAQVSCWCMVSARQREVAERFFFLNPSLCTCSEGTSVCMHICIWTSCLHPWTDNTRLSHGPGQSARRSGFIAALPSQGVRYFAQCRRAAGVFDSAQDAPDQEVANVILVVLFLFVARPHWHTSHSFPSSLPFSAAFLGSQFVPFSESSTYSEGKNYCFSTDLTFESFCFLFF